MRRPTLANLGLAATIVIAGVVIPAVASDTRERLTHLHNKIKVEVGTCRAESVDECRAIAFGAKPCGGPWRYLIYSTATSNEDRLRKLVAEYNALERKLNAEEGRASDCRAVGPPKVALSRGICVARSR